MHDIISFMLRLTSDFPCSLNQGLNKDLLKVAGIAPGPVLQSTSENKYSELFYIQLSEYFFYLCVTH